MFIFSHSFAPSTASLRIAIWVLPEELTHEWDKQSLGDEVVANVASLLQSGNRQCKFYLLLLHLSSDSLSGDILGLATSTGTLSMICKATDVLVSLMLWSCLQTIKHILDCTRWP